MYHEITFDDEYKRIRDLKTLDLGHGYFIQSSMVESRHQNDIYRRLK